MRATRVLPQFCHCFQSFVRSGLSARATPATGRNTRVIHACPRGIALPEAGGGVLKRRRLITRFLGRAAVLWPWIDAIAPARHAGLQNANHRTTRCSQHAATAKLFWRVNQITTTEGLAFRTRGIGHADQSILSTTSGRLSRRRQENRRSHSDAKCRGKHGHRKESNHSSLSKKVGVEGKSTQISRVSSTILLVIV